MKSVTNVTKTKKDVYKRQRSDIGAYIRFGHPAVQNIDSLRLAGVCLLYTSCIGRQKAIRLDVLAANVSAQRFYLSRGFEYCGTVKLFYEDTGLTEFLLYEYIL